MWFKENEWCPVCKGYSLAEHKHEAPELSATPPRTYEQGLADGEKRGIRLMAEAACKAICPRCDSAETFFWPHHVECEPIRRAAAQLGCDLSAEGDK